MAVQWNQLPKFVILTLMVEKKVEKYFTSAPSASLALAALHACLSSHGMASGSRRGIWRLSSKGVVRNKIWRKLKGIRCKRETEADDPSLQRRQEQLDLTPPAKDGRVADAARCTQESDGTTALGARTQVLLAAAALSF